MWINRLNWYIDMIFEIKIKELLWVIDDLKIVIWFMDWLMVSLFFYYILRNNYYIYISLIFYYWNDKLIGIMMKIKELWLVDDSKMKDFIDWLIGKFILYYYIFKKL